MNRINIYKFISYNLLYIDRIKNTNVKNSIILSINKDKIELNSIKSILQDFTLYLYLYSNINESNILFDKILTTFVNSEDDIGNESIKRITYNSNFTLNKDVIYLNLYFIYTIKKYYLHKHISYFYGFINSIESYKKFNTMNLYKNVALILAAGNYISPTSLWIV